MAQVIDSASKIDSDVDHSTSSAPPPTLTRMLLTDALVSNTSLAILFIFFCAVQYGIQQIARNTISVRPRKQFRESEKKIRGEEKENHLKSPTSVEEKRKWAREMRLEREKERQERKATHEYLVMKAVSLVHAAVVSMSVGIYYLVYSVPFTSDPEYWMNGKGGWSG
tara:strand:- start:68 stop:568 length:501 start_codon:yes stop_codon:yes gene_type:complete